MTHGSTPARRIRPFQKPGQPAARDQRGPGAGVPRLQGQTIRAAGQSLSRQEIAPETLETPARWAILAPGPILSNVGECRTHALFRERKEQLGWYFDDWANSAFYTTVATVFLPHVGGPGGRGRERDAPPARRSSGGRLVLSLYGFAFGGGQVVFLPIRAIADYSHRKRQLLGLFAYIGVFVMIALYWLKGDHYLLGGGLFLLANLAFGASVVFYNSFLPDRSATASPPKAGPSATWAARCCCCSTCFSTGRPNPWAWSQEMAVRISLCSAASGWAVFTLRPLWRC